MTIAEPKAIYSRILELILKQDLPYKIAMETLEEVFTNKDTSKGMM
jgi:hypothetical protein